MTGTLVDDLRDDPDVRSFLGEVREEAADDMKSNSDEDSELPRPSSPLLLDSASPLPTSLSPVETLLTLLRRFAGARPKVCARGLDWEAEEAGTEAGGVDEDGSNVGIVIWSDGASGIEDREELAVRIGGEERGGPSETVAASEG